MASCFDCAHFDAAGICHAFDGPPMRVLSDDYYREYYYGVSADARDCNGFDSKGSSSSSSSGDGCFFTSALVKHLGKADDCEELTTLRAFRDNYMKSFACGNALVQEYYRIAPAIVKAIDASDKKDEYYNDIYDTVKKCVDLIKAGDNQNTMKLYVQMVNKYKALV